MNEQEQAYFEEVEGYAIACGWASIEQQVNQ